MPIYAYRCRTCGNEFSTLVRGGETPECPRCAAVDLERQLSLIAKPIEAGGAASAASCGAPMGACGTGGCPAFAGD
jgi:putative FmdB family regulatory protein